MVANTRIAKGFMLVALLISCRQAAAVFCAPGVPHFRYVGNADPRSSAYDKQCTDSGIQTAISHVVCPNTTIVLTDEVAYSNQHLSVPDNTPSFTLAGSAPGAACGAGGTTGTQAVSTSSQITIGGGSGSTATLSLGINDNVTLKSLLFTGGENSGPGGAIYFNGSGSLTLDTVTIDGNKSTDDDGGGIAVNGHDGTATLTLASNTLITNNIAGLNGGGISLAGTARLLMLDDGATVAFNHADDGTGGGILVLGPARADIASSGTVLTGAVSNNTATNGGGIAVIATSTGKATARIFSTNASQPVLISQNSATNEGGAIYLQPQGPYYQTQAAEFCASEFRIDANTAPAGAAIYANQSPDDDLTQANEVYFNPGGDCGPESRESLGAVACAPGVACNELFDNGAIDAHGQTTSASVIDLNTFATIMADRFSMRGNTAAQMITANVSFETSNLSNCLIADNHSTHELIHEDASTFTVDNCTIAQNTIQNGYVFSTDYQFTLTHSIVFQPTVSTIDYREGCCLNASYTLSTETATFPLDASFVAVLTDPMFVDATNVDASKRDYRLRAYVQNGAVTASPAIDFAPPIAGDDRDLDNNPHDQNVPRVTDFQGDRDLGCYEAQPIDDRLFADGFGDPISLLR